MYLPEKWFSKEYASLRQECGVPTFQTKNELAWLMLEPLFNEDIVPFKSITMDEAFGRDTKLLNKIHAKNIYYFAEIPCDTHLWRRRPKTLAPKKYPGSGRPAPRTQLAPTARASKHVDEVASTLSGSQWRRVIVHEGTKGPIEVDIAMLRVFFSQKGLPGHEEWLILRRKPSRQPISDWKLYRSNAPKKTSWKKFARQTAWRWPIETTFKESKSELGMDHYKVRNWYGWHHHMTMPMLSHHFLVRLHVKMGDKAPT